MVSVAAQILDYRLQCLHEEESKAISSFVAFPVVWASLPARTTDIAASELFTSADARYSTHRFCLLRVICKNSVEQTVVIMPEKGPELDTASRRCKPFHILDLCAACYVAVFSGLLRKPRVRMNILLTIWARRQLNMLWFLLFNSWYPKIFDGESKSFS